MQRQEATTQFKKQRHKTKKWQCENKKNNTKEAQQREGINT
jgi:post-segregation antitoxin (ccd killing protein)